MNTTTATATLAQRRTDTVYLVRELSERTGFDEEVARKVRQRHNHSDDELDAELFAWMNIYEESLNNGDAPTAMYALADVYAIGTVFTERGIW